MSESVLGIVVALPCEAKPLTQALNLKRQQAAKAYEYFVNGDTGIHLVVSGVGAYAAAAATGWLAAQCPAECEKAFLNIGIAGGDRHAIGSLYLVSKLVDAATNKAFYPMTLGQFSRLLPYEVLTTVSAPQPATQGLVDMEAYGFYQAAARFTTQELVHCLKVISDNTEQSHHGMKAAQVTVLIQEQTDTILQVIQKLNDLLNVVSVDRVWCEYVISHWRLTQYQQHELVDLLQRVVAQNLQGQVDSLLVQSLSYEQFLQAVKERLAWHASSSVVGKA